MEHQRAFTKLTKRIAIEKTILSYRLAARELGVSVQDAKQILAAYLASDPAKERGVTATYLLSGYLKTDSAANGIENGKGADVMDIDGLDATQSSQNGAGGDEGALAEITQTKTMMVVQQNELEAKTALFSPAPTSHVYALVPTRLTSLALLSASALSLIRPEVREQKWKAAPESAPAYGGIVHPDGERKVPHGKRKAPPMPAAAAVAPKAGPSGTSKPVKKDEAATDSKPVKGKGKAKEKESVSSAAASKGKAKKEEPKIRPIGQLGGLFAKKFDDSAMKKKKGKKKADSDESDADGSDDDDEDEEEVKPKKSIPAKRKSTSPAVSRKKPAPAAAPPQKATAVPAKKTPEIIMDDDDEFGAWDMDEEALLEAERAAEESVKAQAQAKAAGMSRGNSSTSKEASEPRKGETKAERQKRELEEMMKSDDMEIDEKKPSRAPSLSRTPSSSSAAANKSAAEKKKAAAAAPAQKSLGSFFKKG